MGTKLLSTVQAAKLMGYSRQHVALLCKEGKLEGVIQLENGYLIPEDALEKYHPDPVGPKPKQGRR